MILSAVVGTAGAAVPVALAGVTVAAAARARVVGLETGFPRI